MDEVPTSAPKKVCRVRTQGQYMGVRMRSWGKWVSEIRIPHTKRRIWLGSYDDPEKAARAYDAALYCIRGETGRFNFPDDKRPMLPKGEVGFLSKEDIQAFATNFASSVTPPGSSSESVRFDFPDDRRPMLRKGAVDFLSKEDIQTVAANFASLDASVTSPEPSVSTQVSPVLPDFWVSSEMEIACDVDAGSLTPVSVTEAATTPGESLQLDDMLTLDEDWLSDLF